MLTTTKLTYTQCSDRAYTASPPCLVNYSAMLGECGMKERDKQALRKRSVSLCKEMVVDELLVQFLQAENILTDSMAETILVRVAYVVPLRVCLEVT